MTTTYSCNLCGDSNPNWLFGVRCVKEVGCTTESIELGDLGEPHLATRHLCYRCVARLAKAISNQNERIRHSAEDIGQESGLK